MNFRLAMLVAIGPFRQRQTCWLFRFHIDLLLDDDRKCESKRRALADLRLDPDLAAVHLDDALRYGEPQASAAFLAGDGIVGLLEFLEQLGLVGSEIPGPVSRTDT